MAALRPGWRLAGAAALLSASFIAVAGVAHAAEGSGDALQWHADSFGVAPAAAPSSGSGDGSGEPAPAGATVELRIRVNRFEGSFEPRPAVGERVRVDIVSPPHSVMMTRDAVAGPDGVAVLRMPVMEGLQAFARVEGDSDTFAPRGVALDDAGVVETSIDLLPVTSDPSVVFAPRVVTVLEAWEDFVAVSQVWTLSVDKPVRYVSPPADKADPSRGALRFRLPDGAQGIEVVMPRQGATVLDDSVYLHRDVAPSSGEAAAPGLIVRFSLKTNGASTLSFSQNLPVDAENISVVVPRTTALTKHPWLDIDVDAPLCAEGDQPGRVCFAEMSDKAEGAMLREGTEVRVARGGRGRAGDALSVETHGWPGHRPWERVAAGAAGLAAVLAGVMLWMSERRRRREAAASAGRERAAALDAERGRLLSHAATLARRLREGQMRQADYERELAGIQARLAVVRRRLRENQPEPGTVA